MRPTRAGWSYFALTLAVGFAAMNTGNNLMYLVLSLLLSFLVLSGVLSEWALRGVHVRRRLPRELRAEADAYVVLEIENRQTRFPSFAVVVEDLLADQDPQIDPWQVAGRGFALRVGPGETERRRYVFRPKERGRLVFAGFRVATRFPFGLFSKAMRLEARSEALVFPAIDPLALGPRPAPGFRGAESSEALATSGTSPEVTGLRPFAPGDGFPRIHWRASLRRAELLVRDRTRESEQIHWVRLDTRDARPGERFERAVRRAASAVHAHTSAGHDVGLATSGQRIPPAAGPRQRARLLSFLSTIEPEAETRRGAA